MTTPISSAAPAPLAPVPTGPVAGSEQAKIAEAANKLEGVFVSYLVEQMMKSTGMADSQPVYSGLVTEKLGDQLASSGSFGLAALVTGQLGGGDEQAPITSISEREQA